MKHLLSLLFTLLAVPVLAGETVAVAPPNIMDVDALEEVIIEGDRDSLSAARKAIDEAEDRLYSRYNELNDADAYDIECAVEAPTGTLIKRRVCDAKGVTQWTAMEASTILMSTGAGANFTVSALHDMRLLYM